MVSEPIAAESILRDDHSQSDEYGIGRSNKSIAGQSVAAEDETSDNRLQQVVGQTHAAKGAEVAESVSHRAEGVPCRNHRRCDHREDEEVVDGGEPRCPVAKLHEAQHNDRECRRPENGMPD